MIPRSRYGAPSSLWLTVGVVDDGMEIDLQAFNKTQTRLGEASFARFRPLQRDGFRWYMDKLGTWVDPLETVTNGSLHSHGVRDGVAYLPYLRRGPGGGGHPGKGPDQDPDRDPSSSSSSSHRLEQARWDAGGDTTSFFAIDSLDAFVADPATAAQPSTNFLWPLAPLTGPVLGFDMQLHQNAFATNMPLFSLDADFRWRFRLRAGRCVVAGTGAAARARPL